MRGLLLPDLCVLAAAGSHDVSPSVSPAQLIYSAQCSRRYPKHAATEPREQILKLEPQPETSVNRMGEHEAQSPAGVGITVKQPNRAVLPEIQLPEIPAPVLCFHP